MSETVQYPSTTTIVTDTISTGNVSVTLDTLKQWPYLLPSATNSATIQAGMTRLANTYLNTQGGAFWSSYSASSYSTLSITWTPGGSNKSYGCVLLPDGRVLFPPGDGASYIGLFNPRTNAFSSILAASGYYGGVLVPDGRVVFVPGNATNVGVFNPVTSAFTTYASGATGLTGSSTFTGGVLAPDGRVIFCPNNATCIGTFNPVTNSFTTYSSGGPQGANAYWGAILTMDGRVVFAPGNARNVGVFNPVTNSFTTYTGTVAPPGTNAHYGGALVPDGRVIFTPSNTPNVGIFNPYTNQYSSVSTSAYITNPSYGIIGSVLLPNGTVMFCSASSLRIYVFDPVTNTFSSTPMTGTGICSTACLLPDGRVVFGPQNDTVLPIISGNLPVPIERCLNPMFNKY